MSFAAFLALDFWDKEIVDLVGWQNALQEFSDLLSTAVGIGEKNHSVCRNSS